jgi:hypothetical protein
LGGAKDRAKVRNAVVIGNEAGEIADENFTNLEVVLVGERSAELSDITKADIDERGGLGDGREH